MDNHGINMVGPLQLERVASLPVWSASDERRIVYNDSDGTIYYGNSSAWSELGGIPSGTILLIESNTAISGFTLLTTVDDQVVYITKGSGAGGESGGSTKSGSTWTQPNHSHGVGSFTIPNHNHKIWDYVGTALGNFWDSSGNLVSATSYSVMGTGFGLTIGVAGGDPRIPRADVYSENESLGISGTSSSNATANSWRPRGRNFTRQQKD